MYQWGVCNLKMVKLFGGESSDTEAINHASSQRKMPCAAQRPCAMQALNRYPPVGASQSNISPATKTPGMDETMSDSSSDSNLIPPAVLIASGSGRGESSVSGSALTARATVAGSA